MSAPSFHLTLLPNPFDLARREYRDVSPDGRALAGHVRAELLRLYPLAPSAFEWAVAFNGRVVGQEEQAAIIPGPGDRVAISPVVADDGGQSGGSGDVGRTVAMLAVVAATMYFAPMAASYLLYGTAVAPGSLVMGTSLGYSLLTAGIGGAMIVAGSTLVNAVFPAGTADTAGLSTSVDWGSESSTYGWNTSGNPSLNGGALPVLYGTMRVKPYKIGQYVYTDGDTQYLRLLYVVAGHAVDSIESVRINGNAATDYATIETRLGTVGQAVIEDFQNTYYDKASGVTIPSNGDWTTTHTTDGDGLNGLGFGLLAASGLYYVSSSIQSITVKVEIQYRKVGDSSWTSLGVQEITAGQQAAVRRFYSVGNLAQDQYEVRVRFAETPPSGLGYQAAMALEYVQEVVCDVFAYPGVALLAVDALATDQLSGGVPEVDCLVTRSTVDVWNGAEWEEQPATSPAWASWDMLYNPDYGGGADKDRLTHAEFEGWDEFCTDLGLACNIYFDTAMSLPAALGQVGQVGRGRVMQRGLSIGATWDGEADSVYTFDDGNIIAGSFSIDYLPLDDRANQVDVTFYDSADEDYGRKTIKIISADYNASTDEARTSSLTLYACTSKAMAYKHGRFLLRCNQYIRRTASWESMVDAIHCQPGDVVTVQHSLSAWGYGGHVMAANASSVTLDQEVTLEAGTTYKVLIRHKDDSVEEVAVTNSPGTTDTLIVAGWATTPEKWEHWIFGPVNYVGKLFRVASIQRTGDMVCKLTATEYRAEVYADAGTIPEYESGSLLAAVSGLGSKVTTRTLEGLEKQVLNVFWRGYAISWNVYIRPVEESAWTFLGNTRRPQMDVFNLEAYRFYQISVTDTDNPHLGETVVVDFPTEGESGYMAAVTDSAGSNVTKTDERTVIYEVI